MPLDYLGLSVSKGDFSIELGESVARFIGKLLHQIVELNWSGDWAFWEWFWAVVMGLAFILGLVAVLRKTNA